MNVGIASGLSIRYPAPNERPSRTLPHPEPEKVVAAQVNVPVERVVTGEYYSARSRVSGSGFATLFPDPLSANRTTPRRSMVEAYLEHNDPMKGAPQRIDFYA